MEANEDAVQVPEGPYSWGHKLMPRDVQPAVVHVETEDSEVNFIEVPRELRTLHLRELAQGEGGQEHIVDLMARHRWRKMGNELVDTYELNSLESEDEQMGHAWLRENRQQLQEVASQLQGRAQPHAEDGAAERSALLQRAQQLLLARNDAKENLQVQYRKALSLQHATATALPADPMFKHVLKRKRRPAFTVRSLERDLAMEELLHSGAAANRIAPAAPLLLLAGVGAGWLAPRVVRHLAKSVRRVVIGAMVTSAMSLVLHHWHHKAVARDMAAAGEAAVNVNLLALAPQSGSCKPAAVAAGHPVSEAGTSQPYGSRGVPLAAQQPASPTNAQQAVQAPAEAASPKAHPVPEVAPKPTQQPLPITAQKDESDEDEEDADETEDTY